LFQIVRMYENSARVARIMMMAATTPSSTVANVKANKWHWLGGLGWCSVVRVAGQAADGRQQRKESHAGKQTNEREREGKLY
jgi:hypothetical protein